MIFLEPYRQLRLKDAATTDEIVRLAENICARHNFDPALAVPLKKALCEIVLRIIAADL